MPSELTKPRSPALARGFVALAPNVPTRLCPVGILDGEEAVIAVARGLARSLAGGSLAFTSVEALQRSPTGGAIAEFGTLAEIEAWAAEHRLEAVTAELSVLSAPRRPWAGFALDRPLIMGIVNVTPDSFSDGGRYFDATHAIEHGRTLLAAGADILDIGGESTRPGADPVSAEEELRRVLPVIEALAGEGAVLSIDTRQAEVMNRAVGAGARIINDVLALRGEGSLEAAYRSGAAIVLMHMAGEPRTMQAAPHYDDPALDVLDFLEARIAACVAAGIPRDRIMVDPGIGFGKNNNHNLALLRRLAIFHATGCGVLLGVSRKSFIGRLSRGEPAPQRVSGSVAAALRGVDRGAHIVRVHDVAETAQALAIQGAIVAGSAS